MLELFSPDARAVIGRAQEHARRLRHSHVGCEHLLLALAVGDAPSARILRYHGLTAEAVEAEIVRRIPPSRPPAGTAPLDADALAAIGIDLDVVRDRIEAVFGPGALTVPGPAGRVRRLPRLARRRRRSHPTAAAGPRSTRPPGMRTGHVPFTDRAKLVLADAVRESRAEKSPRITTDHLALGVIAVDRGLVPTVLSSVGASPGALRAAILEGHRQAG